MQNNTFDSKAQNPEMPSLILFEQGIRMRLEQFAFNAHTPLDHYQQGDNDSITDYLELTLIELQVLLNEFRVLEWVKPQ